MFTKHFFFISLLFTMILYSCGDLVDPQGATTINIAIPAGYLNGTNCQASVEGTKNLGYTVFIDEVNSNGEVTPNQEGRFHLRNNNDSGRILLRGIEVPAQGSFLVTVIVDSDDLGQCYTCCSSIPNQNPADYCSANFETGGIVVLFMGNSMILNAVPVSGEIEVVPSFVNCTFCTIC